MCVIMMFEDSYPTIDMLKNAEQTNPHGGGMSWINKDGKVEWIKGSKMKPKNVLKLIKKENIQLPIIIHYRIATHGAINDMLCHPFPLGIEAKNDTHGVSDDGVLFHNGIWTDYDEYAMKLCLNRNIRLPEGDMSDSSIMAWCASHIGKNFLEFTEEKITVMTPKGILKYGDGWTEVDKITCSNDNFEPTTFWGTGYTWKGSDVVKNGITKAKKIDKEVDDSDIADSTGSLAYSDAYDEFYEGYLKQNKSLDRRGKIVDDEDMQFYNNCDMAQMDGGYT